MLSKQEIFILNVEIQCLARIGCFCFDTALTSDNVRNLTYMAVYFIDLKLFFRHTILGYVHTAQHYNSGVENIAFSKFL